MRTTLEPTDKLVTLVVNGADVPARVWQGYAESGNGMVKIPVHAYITRIAISESLPKAFHEAFEQELKATAKMRPDVQSIPLRMIL